MLIIPAIDLYHGECVRLRRGNYEERISYSNSPVEIAHRFAESGLRFLHVVDLDGARHGRITDRDTLASILAIENLRVQVGGGVRTRQTVDELLRMGAERVIVGSVAAREPELLAEWIAEFGAHRIAVAVDLRGGRVAVDGWTSTLDDGPVSAVTKAVNRGAEIIICTDIGRDGMLGGANIDLYREIRTAFPTVELIASGGVSSAADLDLLDSVGVSGAIVGTAWYEGHITLRQMSDRSK